MFRSTVRIAAMAVLAITVACSGSSGSTRQGGPSTTPAAAPAFSPDPSDGPFTSPLTVTLTSSTPGAQIYCTTDGSTPTAEGTTATHGAPCSSVVVTTSTTIKAIATASGHSSSPVATGAYVIGTPSSPGRIATPTFSPPAGQYPSAQTVTIACAICGIASEHAVIYYTTDGSDPTSRSATYLSPITVSTTSVIKAIVIAAGGGHLPSSIAAAEYVISTQPRVAAPVFSPTPGTYGSSQTVTVSSPTRGAVARCTTDGSVPTARSPACGSSISVARTTFLRAIATASGQPDSAVVGALYTIAPTTPPHKTARWLATQLGITPSFGWGYGEGTTLLDPFHGEWALGTPLQFFENYLTGMPSRFDNPNAGPEDDSSWWTYVVPDAMGGGAFVTTFIQEAAAGGAVPMFTLYQACSPYLQGCFNADFTSVYFDRYRQALRRIQASGKKALVHIEPDMTGFFMGAAPDPTDTPINLSGVPECAHMPFDMIGYTSCILTLRDIYAPGQAFIGFDPSNWGSGIQPMIDYMKAMHTERGDFTVVQTGDYDAGCFEYMKYLRQTDPTNYKNRPDYYWGCDRDDSAIPTYWDDTRFRAAMDEAKAYHDAFALPNVWWQVSLGVPDDANQRHGANPWVATCNASKPDFQYGYRDTKMQYLFANVDKLIGVDGMAVLFSSAGPATDLATDVDASCTHQFKAKLTAYNRSPVSLP